MRSVLIVSDPHGDTKKIEMSLPEACSVFAAHSEQEALELVQHISIDILVLEVVLANVAVEQTVARVKSHRPTCVVIGILPPDEAEALDSNSYRESTTGIDFLIRQPLVPTAARRIIQDALDKQALLQELADLRQAVARLDTRAAAPPAPAAPSATVPNDLISSLTTMAKTLSTSFDLDRLTHLFLEIVSDILRLNRVSLLIHNRGTGEYRICAQRGLLPQLASNIRLKTDDALPSWMRREGRLVAKAEAEAVRFSPATRQLHAELEHLQAVASVPLLARGNLVGILNIGPRVTGIPYTNAELENLFVLASHVAVSIQDIELYQQVHYQKTYIENILLHMSSGVITINADEKVLIYNRRAVEILGIPEAQVLNKDLRALPSPLGDILFETLHGSAIYRKTELTLAHRQIPLEVSSGRIEDEQQTVTGSFLVFEDLSQRKALEQERRRAIELDLFNRIMATMANEIKNPLVSILTFAELLSSQFENAEFRNTFHTTVQSDVKRLNELVEKLVSFADPTPPHFEVGSIETLLKRCVDLLREEGLGDGVEISLQGQSPVPLTHYDQTQMTKAFLYLLRYLVRDAELPAQIRIEVNTTPSDDDKQYLQVDMIGVGKAVESEMLPQLFHPFSAAQASLVDLGLSVSEKIIMDHSGKLEATSSAEGYLMFRIQLSTY